METPNNVSNIDDPFVIPPGPLHSPTSVESLGHTATSGDQETVIRIPKPRNPRSISVEATPCRTLRRQARLQRGIPRIPTTDGTRPNLARIQPVRVATEPIAIENLPPKVDKGWKAVARRMVGFKTSVKEKGRPIIERASTQIQKHEREVGYLFL